MVLQGGDWELFLFKASIIRIPHQPLISMPVPILRFLITYSPVQHSPKATRQTPLNSVGSRGGLRAMQGTLCYQHEVN